MQSDDRKEIDSLVDSFFLVYQRKDIDGLMALFSKNSPEISKIQQDFAIKTFLPKEVTIGKIDIAGDKAKVRLVIKMQVVSSQVANGNSLSDKINRTLALVKENGSWRISAYLISESELAAALINAGTEQQQREILAAEQELVTKELGEVLMAEGKKFLLKDNVKALPIYQIARIVAEQTQDRLTVAKALNNIGMIYKTQNDNIQALECFHESLGIRENLNDKVGVGKVLSNMADVYQAQGNYKQALEYFDRSRKIAEELNDKVSVARILNNIGTIYQQKGDYRQALKYFHNSLEIREKISDQMGVGLVLNNIGIIYSSQSNYQQALEYLNKSLKISEELNDKLGAAQVLNNIGIVYQYQRDYRQALEAYNKSLKIKQEADDKIGIMLGLNNLGSAYQAQGDYQGALKCYNESLKLTAELGAKVPSFYRIDGNVISSIGEIYRLQKNYPKAVEMAKRAAEIGASTTDPDLFWKSLLDLGIAYRELNQLEEASHYFYLAIDAIEVGRYEVAGGQQDQ
ncbi:MAG: tetratricopeptide repeat protein, partial [Acidobacteriota bacterium]